MRHRPDIWIFSAIMTLALCLATPAEAANTGKHKKPVAGATAHPVKHRRTTAVVQQRSPTTETGTGGTTPQSVISVMRCHAGCGHLADSGCDRD